MSGQSFLELLEWHPRDVDTLQTFYEEQAREARMEVMRAKVKEQMGG